ncbi:MAG: cytochrome c3 family protein [Sandarakinorhabdus sp.]|jgi:predicted CXXCH cytochrome family protein|nr:cytochrome c3 family protein [Sandarakinorhabdus sp.]
MSFIIRQIARRADGGDIIRTRTLTTAEISIGRGTDCDIQLADLAVMLRHARIVRTGPGTVSVEASGGVPFQLAGGFVTRADLALADNPAIAIGPFRLSLSAGDDDAVAITATRVVPAVETADAGAETGIFSLEGALPGKRRMAWIAAAVVLIGLFLLPLLHFLGEDRAVLPQAMLAEARQPATPGQTFGDGRLQLPRERAAAAGGFAPDEVWSSGRLSNAHASLASNCGACHQQAFVSVTDSACQACHVKDALPDHALPARMSQGRLPAGGVIGAAHRAFNLPEGRCTSCHKEHEGEATVLTVAASFCTDCHAGLNNRLPDTPVADVPDWQRHPDFRATLVTTPSLTQPVFTRAALKVARENSGLLYPHALHQSASNAVANMAQKQGLPTGPDGALPCRYCHIPDAAQARFQPITMEKNCSACHDLAFARDGGTLRTLPHGKPEQVAGIIRDFWASRRGGADVALFPRRTPGLLAAIAAEPLPASRADAAVAQVFTGRRFGGKGICTDCHVVSDTGTADISRRFAIAAVTLNDHYLPQGRFPHGKHRSFEGKTGQAACLACHDGAMTSKAATDVLLPGVASCRQCHGAPVKALFAGAPKAGASCDTCHAYHDGVNDRINPGAPVPAGHRRVALAAAETGR